MDNSSQSFGHHQQERGEEGEDEDDRSRSRMDSTCSTVTQSSLGAIVETIHGVQDPFPCHQRKFSFHSTGFSAPGCSRSPSRPSTEKLESVFASPVSIHRQESDIASYDDDPDARETTRGWHEFEKDAKDVLGVSVAEWKDTELLLASMANFEPPNTERAVKKFVEHSNKTYLSLPLASPSHSSLLKHRPSSSLTDSQQVASPYFSFLPVSKSLGIPVKLKSKRPPLPTKYGGSSPLLDNSPPAPPSAKFALFARERAPSPPPILDIIVPGSPLKVPWVGSGSGETTSTTKKARRVSSDVRRSKLGWGRRKTSDGPEGLAKNVEVVVAGVQDSSMALLKLEGGASKKKGSLSEDKPTKTSQFGHPTIPHKASNKENVFNDLTVRPVRPTSRPGSSHIPRPIRA